MRRKRISTLVTVGVLLAVLSLLAAPASAQYDVYKSVPDVDKVGCCPPPGGDMSCWQAVAANLLGGAGWGPLANAQANADAIYGHMTGHFTTVFPGDTAIATNWWLYNYGLNPDAVGGWYQPAKTYNDVTAISVNHTPATYNHLLDELDRCQYVGVQWEFQDALNMGYHHCMTLVGGNYTPHANDVSVWHDSDLGVSPSDDQYNNTWPGGLWFINYPGMVSGVAQNYVTLCPGEQKPDSAMESYDAAWHRDYDAVGNQKKIWRTAGTNKGWGDPTWDPDNVGDNTILQIPNLDFPPPWYKMVYLLVDYKGQNYDPSDPDGAPDIDLVDNVGKTYDADVTISADGGQILYVWKMDDQPPFERIIFPSLDYHDLSGDVKDFNIATECVPEPGTMVLLLVGGAGLILRRRRG